MIIKSIPLWADKEFFDASKKMLSLDEDVRGFAYDDKTGKPPIVQGKLTIGRGRNLTDNGLSPDEIDYLFKNDLRNAINDARNIFPQFYGYSFNRQLGIVNLLFNLGKARFLKFERTIEAIKTQQWSLAGQHLRDSLWAKQVDPKNRLNEGRDDRVINLIVKG